MSVDPVAESNKGFTKRHGRPPKPPVTLKEGERICSRCKKVFENDCVHPAMTCITCRMYARQRAKQMYDPAKKKWTSDKIVAKSKYAHLHTFKEAVRTLVSKMDMKDGVYESEFRNRNNKYRLKITVEVELVEDSDDEEPKVEETSEEQ